MAEGRIHVGDVGTKFRVRIVDQSGLAVPLGAAIQKKIVFRRPDRTIMSKDATTEPDEGDVDSVLIYSTVAGDISRRGRWSIRGHIVFPTGEWRTVEEQFEVYE